MMVEQARTLRQNDSIVIHIPTVMNNKFGGAEVFSANLAISVADPDPSDPHVFGPPGSGYRSISQMYGYVSGSESFYHQAKIKNLDSYYFVTSF